MKNAPYTIVQFTVPRASGFVLHRMTWPMEALGKRPEFRVLHVQHSHPYSYRLAFEADLIVLCMGWDLDLIPILRWRKAKGKPTVFEMDDYIFDVPPWNATFDFWNNPEKQCIALCMMRLADLVQTCAPFLAEAFAPYSSRTAFFPNELPRAPVGLPAKPEYPLVIGWGGSMSHLHDMAHIAPAVSKWITQHDGVALWIMGDEATARLFALPPEKTRFVPWGSMDAYDEFLKGVHLGLAPLRDTPFNRGRSDVKFLEYAANGCVFAGQRMRPYTDCVEDGKTGLLFGDNAELLRVLDRLHADRALAQSVRRAAFEYVTQHRTHDANAHKRAEVYRELITRTPPQSSEVADLDAISRFPALSLPDPLPGFLPLRLDSEEEKALTDLHSARYDIPEASIRLIEGRYGEFHLTQYARAVIAFARRDVAAAERHARRSIELYPANVRGLSFLGQVLLGARRISEARELFSQAILWNREYTTVYPYLVTAAEQMSDWQGALAAADEWDRNRNHDPRASMRRGIVLIRAGRAAEGLNSMWEALKQFKEGSKYWHLPRAAELVAVLRQAEPLASKTPEWGDLLLKAADLLPYGLWLASRAGAICFERGDYARGARLLQQARERLVACEWQPHEGPDAPADFRGPIELYRMACEDLVQETET